jgi:hypothetical protein
MLRIFPVFGLFFREEARMVVRSYNEELEYLERLTPHSWRIKKGFQPNMNVEVIFLTCH